MEAQPQMTKNGSAKGKRIATIAGGLIILAAAVGAVTILVSQNNDNQTPASNKPHVKAAIIPKTAVIHITSTGFQPQTLSVQKGTTVKWLNTDTGLHQIVANPYPKGTDLPNLKSAILNQSQAYTYTATATGSYGYHDQMNPTLNGMLVVKQ